MSTEDIYGRDGAWDGGKIIEAFRSYFLSSLRCNVLRCVWSSGNEFSMRSYNELQPVEVDVKVVPSIPVPALAPTPASAPAPAAVDYPLTGHQLRKRPPNLHTMHINRMATATTSSTAAAATVTVSAIYPSTPTPTRTRTGHLCGIIGFPPRFL